MQKIFISYSHQDKAVKDHLVIHLNVLEKQGMLDPWDDERINAGDDWRTTIRQALQDAHVAIFLVSADFLSSDFIAGEEVPLLLEKRAKEGLHIVPIIIRPCAWQAVAWLEKMHVIKTDVENYDTHFAQVALDLIPILKKPLLSSNNTLKNIRPELPIFIEIQRRNQQYMGSIHQGNREQSYGVKGLKLHPDVKLPMHNDWTWSEWIKEFATFQTAEKKKFGEKVQSELGQFLYHQTLGQLPEALQRQMTSLPNLDLRLLTDDDWIVGLPWHLLSNRSVFVNAKGWSVALADHLALKEVKLPASPKMLVIAPQPLGSPNTGALKHLKDLEENLSASDQRLVFGQNLKQVGTWEAFVEQLAGFEPELVYFYGAIQSEGLVFEKANTQQPMSVSLSDFARQLLQLELPPSLVYLNFCHGKADDYLKMGRAMSEFIPAVICGRMAVSSAIAQAQAYTIWEQLLLKAVSPHQAVSTLEVNMKMLDLTPANMRHVVPVCYAQYKRWEATAPKAPDRLTRDPNWHLKIDRITQYSLVMAQTRLMLREQKPKSLAFTWYGKEGQGVEIFHRRLAVELNEDLKNTFVYEVNPSWPLHLENYHDSFSDMMTTAFRVNELDDIPARIRTKSQGTHGKQTLVYIRHEPVRSSRLINPNSLKNYIEWWDKQFIPLLDKRQFVLLGTSFIVSNPAAFGSYVSEEGIDHMDMRKTVFYLLKEMEDVAKIDLLNFLRTHSIELPTERRDKVLQEILKRTGGKYEHTIDELRKLLKRAWQVADKKKEEDGKQQNKKYDY